MTSRIILKILFLTTPVCWAIDPMIIKGEKSYWQCRAYDSDNQQWIMKSSYQRLAINKAFEACKKQSRIPKSCKTAKEYCDAIIKGVNTRPMWQCRALDQLAKPWISATYNDPQFLDQQTQKN